MSKFLEDAVQDIYFAEMELQAASGSNMREVTNTHLQWSIAHSLRAIAAALVNREENSR